MSETERTSEVSTRGGGGSSRYRRTQRRRRGGKNGVGDSGEVADREGSHQPSDPIDSVSKGPSCQLRFFLDPTSQTIAIQTNQHPTDPDVLEAVRQCSALNQLEEKPSDLSEQFSQSVTAAKQACSNKWNVEVMTDRQEWRSLWRTDRAYYPVLDGPRRSEVFTSKGARKTYLAENGGVRQPTSLHHSQKVATDYRNHVLFHVNPNLDNRTIEVYASHDVDSPTTRQGIETCANLNARKTKPSSFATQFSNAVNGVGKGAKSHWFIDIVKEQDKWDAITGSQSFFPVLSQRNPTTCCFTEKVARKLTDQQDDLEVEPPSQV